MGDSRSKKTMAKIGKLFGVSQGNLHLLDSQVYEAKQVADASDEGKGSSINGLKQVSPFSSREEVVGAIREEDNLSPLQSNNSLYGLRSNNGKNSTDEHNNSIKKDGNINDGVGANNQSANSGMGGNNKNKAAGPRPLMASPRSSSRTNMPTINNTNRIGSPAHSVNSSEDNILFHPQPQSMTSMVPEFNIHSNSNTNLPTISSMSPMNIRSPTISVSSANTNQPTKKTPTSAGGKPTGSNPVSRSSSFKTKHVSKEKDPNSSLVSPSPTPAKPRFRMLENGLHEHNLRSAKRQEKLSNMLKGLLGSKKLRDEAKSAVPNILQTPQQSQSQISQPNDKPPTLFAGLVHQVKNNTSPYHGQVNGIGEQPDCRSFVEKYGRCQEVIGKGSFGVVRISHKKVIGQNNIDTEEKLYAVKEFKRRPNEPDKKYNRRLTSEFCISSSLKNMNIIDTLDLLKDAKGDYCEVMEFCSGGDLYTLIIASGKLEYAEADCFFKQLIRGVNYMHDMGVSHRDLKPENLLLTQNGILKITDFGNGECFKMAWEHEIQFSEGICGSSPYIAPEEFSQHSFDPRGVDIWACGVIYMAMRTGRQLWKLANPKKDEFFEEYLSKRKDAAGYEPIESLKRARCRNVIYSILDPIPERRISGKQILSSEWGREIKVCEAGNGKFDSRVQSPEL